VSTPSAYYAEPPAAKDIFEHLLLLKWYGEKELASKRLSIVAEHYDDPVFLMDKEEEWLNEDKYWNWRGCSTTRKTYAYYNDFDWD
jgi:hypothetical protein